MSSCRPCHRSPSSLLAPSIQSSHHDTELLQIHAAGWVSHDVPIRHRGTFKSLGVLYPINPNDSTSLQLMKQKLIITIRALPIKRASPRAINLVMAKCLYARGAYVGVLSSWSLKECQEIDTVFAAEIRRRLRTSKHPNQRICSNLFVKAVWVINVSPRWFNSESEIACVAFSRGVTNGPAWQSKDYAPVATAALTTPLSLQSPHNVSARVSGSLAFCPTV